MWKGSVKMGLYAHHTVEIDKIKAKNILSNEKTLFQMYDNLLVKQKEGNVKTEIYNLLKDEKNILYEFEEKVKLFGWL
jgi:hypothetical protein